MLEYRELRIRITPDGSGGYRTHAEGPGGVASGAFMPPFANDEIDGILRDISGQVGRKTTRRAEPPDYALVKHFGSALFDALFDGEVRDLYYGSLRAAQDQGRGLRITLALTSVPRLALVPWEFLYDESFLAISDLTPIVRYLDLRKSRDPIEVEPPLRILAMVSAPTGVVELDVEEERGNVDRALAGLKESGAVEITWVEQATLDELLRRLRGGPYHVFHYIGHGDYDEEQEDGVLSLEDERGREDRVSGLHLGATLANHTPLRLAVLNSCEGARGADDDPFAGVASSLVQCQIPAVIAMQFEITDRMAGVFSKWFYESLAAGYPVDRALAQTRLAMFNRRTGLEWGTPVLFMRVQDGRIFDVPAGPPARRRRVTPRWLRRRTAALMALGLLAVIAAVALAYALLTDGESTTTPRPLPPGTSWSAAVVPGLDQVVGLAADGDGLIAVGTAAGRPAVQRYLEGSWSGQRVQVGSGAMNAVVVDRTGTAVAAGRVDYGPRNVDAAVWRRSEDGDWVLTCGHRECGDAARGAVGGRQTILAVTATERGSFVAVGQEKASDSPVYHGAVWRSEDGLKWERVADEDLNQPDEAMNGVAAIEDRLVAVGRSGRDGAAWMSTDDGVSWRKVPDEQLEAQGRSAQVLAVHSGPSGVVAVGSERRVSGGKSGAAAWFSATGGSWSRMPVRDVEFSRQQMADVVSTPRAFFAVGTDLGKNEAAVWRSAEGTAWRRESSTAFSVGKAPGMSAVAVLSDGTVFGAGATTIGERPRGQGWTAAP
jgi:hypothetical protein